jgi:hypothetical protein
MSSANDATWRNRFLLMNLIRLGGLAGVLVSILLWQSNVFVAGGTIIGLPLGLLFLILFFFGPKLYASRFREPPTP